MAGRTGGRQKTIGNLEVVSLNKEDAVLMVKGAIPGYKNSEIKIQKDASFKARKKAAKNKK